MTGLPASSGGGGSASTANVEPVSTGSPLV
jgi:hypothetical protein